MAAWQSVFRPNLFQSKVAIVTGGGSGIGKQIAKELTTLGCGVIISSRNLSKLSNAVEEIRTANTKANINAIQCNIRCEEDVMSLMDQVVNQYGRIDFLVNNGNHLP